MGKEILVSPRGGERRVDGNLEETKRLQEAIDLAEPGTTIRLLSGVYDEPGVFECKSGTQTCPIILQGDGGVTFDGRRQPFRPADDHPRFEHPAFLKIKDSGWIVVRDLAIQNTWPTAIFIQDSSHLSLERVNFHGGTFAIFCRGERTHDVLIARCAWMQDPDIWQDIHWDDIHAFPRPRKELDGDFLRAVGVRGRFEIRNNLISNAFNGIHFFALAARRDREAGGRKDAGSDGSQENPYDPNANRDIVIANNTFMFIRDNAVESEFQATNWWVYGNRIYNCHKWFAFENSLGGYWYLFANVGWFDRKPGPPFDDNSGGSVLKTTKYKKRVNAHPFYMFHNSWYLRSSFMKKGLLRNFHHFNNAIEFCDPEKHPPGVGQVGRRMFGDRFLAGWFEASDEERKNIKFLNDVCNHRQLANLAQLSDLTVDCQRGPLSFMAPREGFFWPDPSKKVDGSSVPDLLTGKGRRYDLDLMGPHPNWQLPAHLNIGAIRSHNKAIHRDVAYDPEDLGCPSDAIPKADVVRDDRVPDDGRDPGGA